MDFSNCGALEVKGDVQRAHVQWSDNGSKRNIRGPFPTLSVVVFDREGAWISTLLMHRPANSCLRHEPFLAAEPGQQLCL